MLLHKADGSGLVGRLVGLSERIESVAFSPDGKIAGRHRRLARPLRRSADLGRRHAASSRYSLPVTYDTVYGASWSGDGTKIAFGCADNTVRAIDAATGKQVLFQGAHSDWVLDTVFSNDGTYLVSVSRDRSMKLTEVATQRFVDNITSITPGALKGGLTAVDRHPTKDELLIGGADGVPKIYQMHRTKARVIGDDFNLIQAYEADAGPDLRRRTSTPTAAVRRRQQPDGTGEVRDLRDRRGKLLHKLAGQHGAVYAVAFQPRRQGRGLGRLRRPGALERRRDRQADQGVRAGAADAGQGGRGGELRASRSTEPQSDTQRPRIFRQERDRGHDHEARLIC